MKFMEKKKAMVLTFLVVLGVFLFTVNANPSIGCGETITTNTVLAGNLDNCGGHGIIIGANNITLDCNGYTIDGIHNPGDYYGVYLNGKSNVEITTCNLEEFYFGIYATGSTYNIIHNNNARDNIGGLTLAYNSNYNNVLNNNFSDNSREGMQISQNSHYNNVFNNNLNSNNVWGVNVAISTNNIFYDNEIHNNGNQGANLQLGSTNNQFFNNNFVGNNVSAYEEADSTNLWDNGVVGNYWDDYSGTGNYDIFGPGNGIDNHPTGPISCGDTITSDTILTEDLTGCTGDGLVIGANDITLDCNGHTISGFDTDSTHGIYSNGFGGLTIKDCNVADFWDGTRIILGSGNNIVTGNSFNSNLWNGIHLNQIGNGNLFENNILNNNQGYGLQVSDTYYSNFIGNHVEGNGIYGIYVDSAQYNAFYSNEVVSNGQNAIERQDPAASNNEWDDGISIGNYWSDYSGIGIYEIPGPGDGVDHYPTGPEEDVDGDGILDEEDNCVNTPNPYQWDLDEDGVGDWCDNCPLTSNSNQADSNGNDRGDACESCSYKIKTMCSDIV